MYGSVEQAFVGSDEPKNGCEGGYNHRSDEQNRTTAKRESDLLITSMITDRTGRHNVLLSIIITITISQKQKVLTEKHF